MKLPQAPLMAPSRRELLQLMGAGAAWLALPAGCARKGSAPYKYKFLTAAEIAALGALANAVLPPDQAPGGQELGVAEYTDRLLAAFEGGGPLYGGGPYSGRAPLPNSDGTPSKKYPADDFPDALPLDRISAAHYKLFLYGSAGVTGGAPNDASGTISGLRDQVRTVLATAAGLSSQALDKLTQPDIEAIFGKLDGSSQVLLINLVSEAAFAAPEYGGNTNLAGWALASFEGDRQPVGFSWFNPSTGLYTEDPNHPVTAQTPGSDPAPIDATTTAILNTLFGLPSGLAFELSQTF